MFQGLDKVELINLRQCAIGQIVINDRVDAFYPYPGSKIPKPRCLQGPVSQPVSARVVQSPEKPGGTSLDWHADQDAPPDWVAGFQAAGRRAYTP